MKQEVKIPIRKLNSYLSDDGCRIEEWTKILDITEKVEEKDIQEYEKSEVVYVGVVHIFVPNSGPKEIKFQMPVKNVKEGFERYKEFAQLAMKEIEARIMEQNKNKIVTPTPKETARVSKGIVQ
jgi:hypothetical protein